MDAAFNPQVKDDLNYCNFPANFKKGFFLNKTFHGREQSKQNFQ